ncbi:MAG TPA: BlaI/MecI/CopY family transcriptional regulator [Polyangiales bacterium]|jgi:BlaI family penicillinase repressor|nr:BlaI/MecI/CopY family transcriptional regulator [Polyangiales bacterium]
MKKSLPILTPAESEVMQILWSRQAASVHDVVGALLRPVAYNTALTILRVLEQKGYVTHEPHPENARSYLYRATIPPGPVRVNHTRDLVERLFEGKADELVSGLIESERLSRGELEALRAQIDRKLGTPSKKDSK